MFGQMVALWSEIILRQGDLSSKMEYAKMKNENEI